MYLAAYMCNIFGSHVHWTLKNSDTQENTLQILIWRACMCIIPYLVDIFCYLCIFVCCWDENRKGVEKWDTRKWGKCYVYVWSRHVSYFLCILNEYLNKGDDVKYSCSSFNFMNHSLEQHLIIQNTENFDLLRT